MSVTVSKPADAQETKAQVKTKGEQKYMHLVGAKTLVTGGILYQAGVAYPVTDDQLAAYENYRLEGKQMFARYVKPKKVVRVSVDDDTEVLPIPVLEVERSQPVLPAIDTRKRIEVGDDSELSDIEGLNGDVSEVG